MTITMNSWVCTDPLNLLFYKEEGGKFLCKQFDSNQTLIPAFHSQRAALDFVKRYWNQNDIWFEHTIDLNNYSLTDQWNAVSPFYSQQEFERLHQNGNLQPIALCLFDEIYLYQ